MRKVHWLSFSITCLTSVACGPQPTNSRGSGGRGGAGGVGGSSGVGGGPSVPCDRASIKSTVDSYFAALSAHDPSRLALAPNARYTENGREVKIGEGLWKTAGPLKTKRSALDEQLCTSVTESVIPENNTDIVVGLRLKSIDQKLTEIEAIVARAGDYISDPSALLRIGDDNYETLLPEAERWTREKLQSEARNYFENFPAGACNFAPGCLRYENGFSIDCSLLLSCGQGSGIPVMSPRLLVADVPAGIGIGFVMWGGLFSDFHMFKVSGGHVRSVHTVLASAPGPGW